MRYGGEERQKLHKDILGVVAIELGHYLTEALFPKPNQDREEPRKMSCDVKQMTALMTPLSPPPRRRHPKG